MFSARWTRSEPSRRRLDVLDLVRRRKPTGQHRPGRPIGLLSMTRSGLFKCPQGPWLVRLRRHHCGASSPNQFSVRRHIEGVMKTLRQPAIILVILLAAMPALGGEAPCPLALAVLPGAEKVSCGPFEGTVQIGYNLTVAYPAEDAIRNLRRQLQEGGWLLLAEDFLMPGRSSAAVEGWSVFLDSTQGPAQRRFTSGWLHWVEHLRGQRCFAFGFDAHTGGRGRHEPQRPPSLRALPDHPERPWARVDLAESHGETGIRKPR